MTSSLVVMGLNDQFHCVSGWHMLERDQVSGVWCRWTAVEASFRIGIPPGAAALRIMVAGPCVLTRKPAAFSLHHAGNLLAHLPDAVASDAWTIADVPLPPELPASHPDGALFTLRSERDAAEGAGTFEPEAFIPDRHLHNGDHRELGIKVAAMRVLSRDFGKEMEPVRAAHPDCVARSRRPVSSRGRNPLRP